ncbi:Acetyltransferase (GNAT) family protein [Syntrophus gentianae]|uniref:Acetyltransferase (GNAT) family protein n=1 Tax=Syntrophus gentianae TaxID=43775 RepID=A0A1H7YTM0_9BACT|nr:GNAT family N-acetyltransferase [Syntrophus gentianae]SEM49323.1 Acetyltransferase (GNAT) family protein [Syntrophus gentianae]
MKALIREGKASDIEALSQLLAGLFALETDFVPDTANQIAGLRLLLADRRRNVVFVAEDDGNLVGMVTGQLVISTAAGGYSVLIEDMVIREHYRRQGLGTALLRKVAAWGEEGGALRHQLLADRRNAPALDFYRNFGFQQSFMIGLYKMKPDEE